jgi:hypothetical protein
MAGTPRPKNPPPKLVYRDRPPSSEVQNKIPMVQQGLRVIDPHSTTEAEFVDKYERQRLPYAPMRAHKELAAQVLAVGGTYKMAAARGGVSVRQIRKYVSEADFRQRVEELRTLMLSRVRGRIMTELSRRTTPEKIQELEILDLLRVWDRVVGPRGSSNTMSIGEVNVHTHYDNILQAILTPNAGPEGSDFPRFEPDRLALPGESSPVEG